MTDIDLKKPRSWVTFVTIVLQSLMIYTFFDGIVGVSFLMITSGWMYDDVIGTHEEIMAALLSFLEFPLKVILTMIPSLLLFSFIQKLSDKRKLIYFYVLLFLIIQPVSCGVVSDFTTF